jgi:hypothetical protein
MERSLASLLVATVLLSSSPLSAQLLKIKESPFVVEPFAGMVFQLNDLAQKDATGLQSSNAQWGTRVQMGAACAMRVWDPLHLDAGLRLGLSFQNRIEIDSSSHSYDPAITMIELTPFARGTIYPFKTAEWGATFEFGLGLLIATGGKQGNTEYPENAQTSLRIRFALGALWRYDESMALTFDIVSLVTDISLMSEWKRYVGTAWSLEPRIGWQYRF